MEPFNGIYVKYINISYCHLYLMILAFILNRLIMKWDAFVHQVTILFDALWHRSLEQETDIDKQHLKTYNHKDLELRILQQESFNYQKGFDTFQKRIQVNRNISL